MSPPPSRRGRPGKRSPPGRGPRRVAIWVLLACVLLAVAAVPSASFETATIDRAGTVDVVDDPDGLLGVDHAQNVSNQDDSLVVVFNRFQTERTITVTLGTCTDAVLSLAADGEHTAGTLMDSTADSITFTLPSGGSQEILIDVSGTQCDSIDTATKTDDGLTTVELSRTANVEQGQGGGGNGGDPPGQGGGDPPGHASIDGGVQNALVTGVHGDYPSNELAGDLA